MVIESNKQKYLEGVIEYENKFQQLERNLKDTEKLISLDSEIGEMERVRDQTIAEFNVKCCDLEVKLIVYFSSF